MRNRERIVRVIAAAAAAATLAVAVATAEARRAPAWFAEGVAAITWADGHSPGVRTEPEAR